LPDIQLEKRMKKYITTKLIEKRERIIVHRRKYLCIEKNRVPGGLV
jgi:hypothetical protein